MSKRSWHDLSASKVFKKLVFVVVKVVIYHRLEVVSPFLHEAKKGKSLKVTKLVKSIHSNE